MCILIYEELLQPTIQIAQMEFTEDNIIFHL
jgi:hypothetical protein